MEHKNKFVKSLCIAAFLSILCIPQINSKAMAQAPVPTLDKLNQEDATIPDTDPEQVYPESAYTLTEIKDADPENLPQNAITLYDKTEVIKYYDPQTGQEVAVDDRLPDVQYKEVTTIQTTPKYYTVNLKDSITNIGEGDSTKYFEWSQNADGRLELKEVSAPTEGKNTITVKYDTSSLLQRIPNDADKSSTNISGTFVNQTTGSTSGNQYGGAIYNNGTNAKLGDINADFIGNYASSNTYVYGGGIYNYYGTIGDVTGDFIGNYVSSSNSYAQGGAIYNYRGSIGDITGDFIGNYASSTGSNAYGGAIYNYYGTIGDVTGDFIGNYVSGSYRAYGGAVYNEKGSIGNITGNFIGNYVNSQTESAGAAIYNAQGTIGDITGDFINNTALSNTVGIGAITSTGDIGNITGDFIGNSIILKNSENPSAQGAAISQMGLPDSFIKSVSGSFINNHIAISGENIDAQIIARGGAIASTGGAINQINADFINNYIDVNVGDSSEVIAQWIGGGAIFNANSNIDFISGDFIGNHVSTNTQFNMGAYAGASSMVNGGAIFNVSNIGSYETENTFEFQYIGATIVNSETKETLTYFGLPVPIDELQQAIDEGKKLLPTVTFLTQDVDASNWDTYVETIKQTIENDTTGMYSYTSIYDLLDEDAFAQLKGGIVNSSFINNYVYAPKETAHGGAIYTTTDLLLTAKDGYTSVIKGNYVEDKDGKRPEAIYVDSPVAKITLQASNKGSFVVDDQISGFAGYKLKLGGDDTGVININNDVINANISLDNTNLYLGREDVFNQSQSLSLNSGSIYLNNQSVGTMHIPTLNLNGNTNISVDADLANKSMDRITADNYNVTEGAMLNVNNVVLLSDAKEDVTNIQFADDELASNVAFTGASPIAYSPIWKYDVSYNPDDGFFTFSRGASASGGNASDAFNPSVLASPVATQAGAYTTQLQTFNYAFQHADTFMNIPYLERVAIINQGKYALSPTGDATDVGTYSPLMIKQHDPGFWVKPYASFENVPLKNGPKVSNINYGTLVGYDSPLQSISNGFERVLTGYIGYNGASQRYSGVDAYQNGGLLGGTATFYKGNFFNATTLSVGASAGDASTMYGSENYTMLLAGLGNKTGYNFEFFNGGMILQPSMLISYTFVNTFDYNNAAGVRIESDPMHAIQLAPGIKLIGNTKNGWQPYIGVSMVWNLLDESKVTADSVRLPEMSIKPYVQYGVGIQKRFKDKFLAFGQAMIHNGGRNGVSLSAGLRWKIGRE